jgi:hypothetical protein
MEDMGSPKRLFGRDALYCIGPKPKSVEESTMQQH